MNSPITIRTDSSQHHRHSASNNKVKQPLRCRANGHIKGSESSTRDLRDIDPTDRPPAKLEERRKEEDANQSEVAGRDDWGSLDWRGNTDVQTDVKHCQALSDGCPEKGAATTEGVGDEDEEDAAADHFHDAVDAGCEEIGCVTHDAQLEESYLLEVWSSLLLHLV